MFQFFDNLAVSNENFKCEFSCYSISVLFGDERSNVQNGGKIIMPPSALEMLTRLNVNYPMLFKITNRTINRISHCGVLEFVSDEGIIYMPHWMMQNLLIEEGGCVLVESISLPIATYAKFQPQTSDFLDITNHKAVLERALREFACLTTDDIIVIDYNEKKYELSVLETNPSNAVSIIECDMNVEFAAPLGYKEEIPKTSTPTKSFDVEQEKLIQAKYLESLELKGIFQPFSGQGKRLDEKKKVSYKSTGSELKEHKYMRGIPDFTYKPGKLTFFRGNFNNSTNSCDNENDDSDSNPSPFSGTGRRLRENKA